MPPAVRRLLFVALLIPAILFGLIATPKLRPRRDSDASIPRHLRSVQVPTPQIPGLAEILVVSLPSAVERRKMIWDLAKLTGIRVEFVDAVGLGSVEVEMTRKRIPDQVAKHKDYVLATWWSHYRAWELIADRFPPTGTHESQRLTRTNSLLAGNETEQIGLDEPRVLILEDDVDWEVDLKHRLPILMDAAAASRADEYGDGQSKVVGWDLFYPGWCFEFDVEKQFEVPGLERVYKEIEVEGKEWDGEQVRKRRYQIARPIFPACLHSYIITPTTASYLIHRTLPYHVLHPTSFPTTHEWDPIDIWMSNKPAKHAFRTAVLHPPVFKQMGGKAQGEELLKSAREVHWERTEEETDEETVQELKSEQEKRIQAERGEVAEDRKERATQ